MNCKQNPEEINTSREIKLVERKTVDRDPWDIYRPRLAAVNPGHGNHIFGNTGQMGKFFKVR